MVASGLTIKCLPSFRILYNLPDDTNIVVLIGGRGGAKSYEASKFIAKSATIDRKRCVVLRDEKSKIRQSILNEILNRYDSANKYGHLDQFYHKLETGIKDRKTNDDYIFTMGFRASSNDKRAGLKSVSDIDIAIIEEAEDIRDEDKFNTFADSIRNQGSIIIIVLNTPDIHHWLLKRYFIMHPVPGEDGYFDIEPKQIKGFVCIKTGYEDNPYLPQHIIDNYNAYGDPSSHLYNLHYYLTAIKGYASSGRKGQILTKVKTISLKEYLALPYKEIYGQDFGTASPAGLVGVKFLKNNCYCREINYLPKNVKELGKMYSQLKFNNTDKIYADTAEPDTIKKLKDGWKKEELTIEETDLYPLLLKGFFIEAAPSKDISAGISALQSLNLYAVTESKNLWNEIYNYIWAVDKNKNPTDEPIDDFNHLIDPWRYIVLTKTLSVKTQSNLQSFAGAFR